VREKVRINMFLILHTCWDRAVWICRPNSVRFLFVGWKEEWRLRRKMDTQDELLLGCFLDAAVWIKKQDQLMTNSRWFHTWIAKCIEDDVMFEHLL